MLKKRGGEIDLGNEVAFRAEMMKYSPFGDDTSMKLTFSGGPWIDAGRDTEKELEIEYSLYNRPIRFGMGTTLKYGFEYYEPPVTKKFKISIASKRGWLKDTYEISYEEA